MLSELSITADSVTFITAVLSPQRRNHCLTWTSPRISTLTCFVSIKDLLMNICAQLRNGMVALMRGVVWVSIIGFVHFEVLIEVDKVPPSDSLFYGSAFLIHAKFPTKASIHYQTWSRDWSILHIAANDRPVDGLTALSESSYTDVTSFGTTTLTDSDR